MNTIKRISLVTTIFSTILMFQCITLKMEQQLNVEKYQNAHLTSTIEEYYIPQQMAYEETLKNITRYISKTDSFLGIGGSVDGPLEYIDSVVFEEILNTQNTSNFNIFLSNIETYFNERTKYFDELPSIWPLEYSPRIRITSGFGERFSPFTGKLQMHSGIDMVSTSKAKILATSPGTVVEYWPPRGTKGPKGIVYKGHPLFGGYVVIEHANGYRTHYAHLSEVFVKSNTVVTRGLVIGRMGNTGLSNGEHLHYGIEKYNEETQDWEFIDPINFLRDVKY